MGSGFKDWAAGDVLTAADVDGYLMRQTVMTFADSSARDTALSGVLDEGMVAYLEDTDVFTVYDGSSWFQYGPGKILQVVSTTKTDTFSTTSTTFTDVTGLSVAITPTSATSKVLVLLSISTGPRTSTDTAFQLVRDSTNIAVSTGGTNNQTFSTGIGPDNNALSSVIIAHLDSPSTTSATTYQIEIKSGNGDLVHVNRRTADGTYGAVSSITVMEVSA